MLIKETVDELVDFFTAYFSNENKAKEFVVECLNSSEEKRNAKLILHQTQRLITLADKIFKIKRRDSLRVLFLIICAEAIAKLYENFIGENLSKDYTWLFFDKLCDREDLESLNDAIAVRKLKESQKKYLSGKEVINFLYKVRCSVVHEGIYWEFAFKEPNGDSYGVPSYKSNKIVYSYITYETLRNVIIRGAIRAIKTLKERG